jgi:hypothetical protein
LLIAGTNLKSVSRMLSSGIELRGMAFACVAGESGVVVVEIDLQECSV